MKTPIAPVIVAIALLAASELHGQMNKSLAGTWALSQEAGGGGGGGRGGRGGGIPGVPLATLMVVKLSPAEVIVETNTGSAQSMQSAVYKVDGSETTVPGPLGWTVKAKAAWKDSTLVVNTVRSLEGPNGPVGAEIVDVYSVNGDVLTLERTQGRNKQKLVYNRKS
jgi:hypothetical protein